MLEFLQRFKSAEGLICQHEQLIDQMQMAENRGDGQMINELSKQDLQVCHGMTARGCKTAYNSDGDIIWVKGTRG